MATSVTILNRVVPPLRWVPMPGDYTEGFLRRKSSDPNGPSYPDLTTGDNCVLLEAQRILGRCLPPTEFTGPETGLVVGYVQSGKTMSFETVISLARDNGYGMVIVLAGTKINLKEQSEKRLKKDLGIEEGNVWYHFSNPATPNVRTQIKDKLLAWHRTPERRRAVLITVLKNKRHLETLKDTLKRLVPAEVPVLIIDDEGDQASLNTKAAKNRRKPAGASDERSTIYNCIADVRATVSHHSYLQYTATPQANLLLAQADLLNPNFAELVTPGKSYTGGRSFFDKPQRYVVEIPEEEVPSDTNMLSTAPKSLHSAFHYFLLAAAQHSLTKVPGRDLNRSMMVHPSMQTSSHKVYMGWMGKVLTSTKSYIYKNYKTDYESVAQRFRSEYNSLTETFPSIRPLPELINAMAEEVLNGELNLVAVNSTPEAEKNVDWKQTAYWILVGGNKLDRGYTVEGLCSTYMPRFLGKTPTADTLQQRARFFGYKEHYLGLCRVFVQGNVRDAYTEYVEHEEFVRKALEATQGQPLREWRREFLLAEMLRPTRPNVIGRGIKQMSISGWIVPSALQRDEDAAASNRTLLTKVRKDWESNYQPAINAAKVLESKPLKGESRHFVIQGVMLRDILEDFLLKIQVKDPQDAEEHSALLISITEAIREDSQCKADVFLMNNLNSDYRTRVKGHGLDAEHRYAPINQYFSQSAGSVNDKHYCSKERVTLQLRKFDLGTIKRDETKADIRNVTWFALHMPSNLEKGIVVESDK